MKLRIYLLIIMKVFYFNEAIFKYKVRNLIIKLELELNTDILLTPSTTNMINEHINIYRTNLKVLNFDKTDKGKIICFFKNNGFIHCMDNKLKDRLIFKYMTKMKICLI